VSFAAIFEQKRFIYFNLFYASRKISIIEKKGGPIHHRTALLPGLMRHKHVLS